jgi:hypothetical protein
MNILQTLGLSLLLAGLAACGGGGGGGSASNNSSSSLSASGSASVPVSNAANVQPVTVAQGLFGTYNLLTTSVTICVPGTTQCQTIDNVQVDTGSVGLRLLSSAISATLALPGVTASGGGVSGACGVFGSGYTWGAVRRADVKMAGETASNLPIQVIADTSVPIPPSDCTDRGNSMQTQTSLQLNGILGIGLFQQDCGSACATQAVPSWYYNCTSTGCTDATQPLNLQIANPVSAFASDNNGEMLTLPSLPGNGVSTVTGALTFGIGTQSNNGLGSATVLPTSGTYVTSVLNGTTNSNTFLDSGSNAYFFSDSSLTTCGTWYCEDASMSVSVESGSKTATASMSIADMTTLEGTLNFAFNDLAGPTSNVVDLGLPFFYGRNVYSAIEGKQTPGGTGPYYAF